MTAVNLQIDVQLIRCFIRNSGMFQEIGCSFECCVLLTLPVRGHRSDSAECRPVLRNEYRDLSSHSVSFIVRFLLHAIQIC